MSELNPSCKFYWDDGKDVGQEDEKNLQEWVELKVIPDTVQDKMRKELGIKTKAKYMSNKLTKRMERLDEFELDDPRWEELFNKMLDYQISGWNLLTDNGDTISCTIENKLELYNGEPRFKGWIDKKLAALKNEIDGIEEESLGN